MKRDDIYKNMKRGIDEKKREILCVLFTVKNVGFATFLTRPDTSLRHH